MGFLVDSGQQTSIYFEPWLRTIWSLDPTHTLTTAWKHANTLCLTLDCAAFNFPATPSESENSDSELLMFAHTDMPYGSLRALHPAPLTLSSSIWSHTSFTDEPKLKQFTLKSHVLYRGQEYKEKHKLDSTQISKLNVLEHTKLSFLSTDCELSTETCSKNIYSLGPRSYTRLHKVSQEDGQWAKWMTNFTTFSIFFCLLMCIHNTCISTKLHSQYSVCISFPLILFMNVLFSVILLK